MWSISRIELSTHHQYRRIYGQLNIAAWISRFVIILDFTGTKFDIAQSGYCALYLAAIMDYKTHRFVDTLPVTEELCSIEY
jgi:pyridoxal/pyridoxine/pyridoxamine kinase